MKIEKFTLIFPENYFKKNDTLEGVNELKTAPWYLRILGFCIVYKTLITSDPVHVREYYEYTCKIVAMELHWLWWKIYKYKNYVK